MVGLDPPEKKSICLLAAGIRCNTQEANDSMSSVITYDSRWKHSPAITSRVFMVAFMIQEGGVL